MLEVVNFGFLDPDLRVKSDFTKYESLDKNSENREPNNYKT